MLQKEPHPEMTDPEAVQVVDCDEACPRLPIVDGEGIARAVIWPGAGARLRSMHLIRLGSQARTIEMTHPMEAVYYVISGAVLATDVSTRSTQRAVDGSMILVEPGTPYLLRAEGAAVEMVGGPCPPDRAIYDHLEK
jgi:mannose-6-phosphate isomerase-like protein (cupin superfamily)